MVFRLEDYPQHNAAMHCTNEEEAQVFTKYLHEHGRRWKNGTLYTDDVWVSPFSYYLFNRGLRGTGSGLEIVLEFSDFQWEGWSTAGGDDGEWDEGSDENDALSSFLRGFTEGAS